MKFTILIEIPDDVLTPALAEEGITREQFAADAREQLADMAADIAKSLNGAQTTTTVE